jgi:hypothetical protein
MYAGCTALVVGNSVKAGVRFVSYERFKQALADKDVSSPPFSLSSSSSSSSSSALVITTDRLTYRSWHQGKSQRAAKSRSRARCGDDGGHLRRHTFRNDQVRLPVIYSSPHPSIHLSPSHPSYSISRTTLIPGTSEQNETNWRCETTSTAVSRSHAWHRVHCEGRRTFRDISWVIPSSKFSHDPV